jgi:hypothetical protein
VASQETFVSSELFSICYDVSDIYSENLNSNA